jgi:hypothetical protein
MIWTVVTEHGFKLPAVTYNAALKIQEAVSKVEAKPVIVLDLKRLAPYVAEIYQIDHADCSKFPPNCFRKALVN